MVLKRHLKRIAASKYWPIERKKSVFVIRPYPSGLLMDYTLPIGFVLKDMLHVAKNNKEVKYLLTNNKVFVNNKVVHDIKSPIKLLDTLSIPDIESYYRLSLSIQKKLKLVMINKDESNKTVSKIVNKTILKNNKIQLNFHDGTNIISDESYQTGTSILFELPNHKILEVIPFEVKNYFFVIKGSHLGRIVQLKEKKDSKSSIVVDNDNNEFLVLNDGLIGIGKDSPFITLE